MVLRRRATVTAVVLLAVALAGGTASGAKPKQVAITSTLDGKAILPYRIRWLATPGVPAVKVKSVRFLIDGAQQWVEKSPPFTFGDDENGAHRGFLVTSLLTPGKHRFTVRVATFDGRAAEKTVVARVLPSPEPPARLAGTWQRTIQDTSSAPPDGSPGNPTGTLTPGGTYTMVIEKRWIQVRFPGTFHSPESDDTGEGWIIDNDYSAGPASLRAFGGITKQNYEKQAEGGWWCYADGPPTGYAWSVDGDTLTLTPNGGSDPCGVRGFVWAGKWTRVR
jgi:hypothetical protein